MTEQAPAKTGDDNLSVSPSEENDNPITPSPEDKNKAKEGDGDKDGFHNHPDWIDRENKHKDRYNEQEKRHAEDIEKIRKEQEEATKPKGDSDIVVPSWFGGDVEAYKGYLKALEERDDKVRTDTIKEMSGKTEAAQKEVEDATDYMYEELEKIEKDEKLNPDKIALTGEEGEKNRNRLMKYAMDNDIVNYKTKNWDWQRAFKFLQLENRPAETKTDNKERKQLASATTSERKGEPKKESITGSDSFKTDRPW